MKYSVFFLCLLLSLPVQALEVTGVRSKMIKNGERISVFVSQKVNPVVELADRGPPRLVVDIPAARWKTKQKEVSSNIIKGIRMGTREKKSRIVMDLTNDVNLKHVRVVKGKGREYSIEFELLVDKQKADKRKAAQFQPIEKPVVIIDAGHGGQDPGTAGVGGVKEKQITLRFAEALRDSLLKSGRYKVVLTRSDDRYLFLKDRVKIARQAKGNLFISLHADAASSRSARGVSVYTISQTASDKESEALAAKENKADIIGGMDLSTTDADVADILIELAERETRGKSAQFAKLVIKSLSREIHLLSNTHRFAGFAVLKAPDIPSILVEVGFLTSPEEEKQLESETYRTKVAKGLSAAVDNYFSKGK